MSILIDADTRVIVQGMTGKMARYHTQRMLAYGTSIVGGVVPGKGGETVAGQPVFDTVEAAVAATGATASIVFVPSPFAADSLMEAADAGISFCTCITEGIPAQDMIRVKRYMFRYPKERRMVLTGPSCAGVISPGRSLLGVMPEAIYAAGRVGLVARSATLGFEAAAQLQRLGLGISTAVGLGGDPINGSSFKDMLERFEADPETDLIVMIGETGGPQEEEAADYIRCHMSKPVVAYVTGFSATSGPRAGHAGAIISAFADKQTLDAGGLAKAGAHLVASAAQIGQAVQRVLLEGVA